MKTIFFSSLLLSAIIQNSLSAQNALSFEPSLPKPGDKIIIRYNPSSTPLLGINEFDGYAFLLRESCL